jgi:hypothetical protein
MRAKACTTCRQRKHKCDAPQKYPQGCTRCSKLKKACIFDPNFKRISKHHQLQQVQNGLKTSKQAITTSSSATSICGSLQTLSTSNDEEPDHKFGPCIHEKAIGNITLVPEEVTTIFKLYFEKLHVHLPFDMIRSIEALYDICPLLFWVIIAVSCQNSVLVKDLIPYIKQMVSEITLKPARNVEIVQALLILCMWPFPYHTQLEDPSFIYCGMATNIGLQIGLHRPEFAYEFNSKLDVLRSSHHTRRTTWIACYIINHLYAVRYGVPCSVNQDYNLLVSLDHICTPSYLGQLGQIIRLSEAFTNAIGFNAQNLHGLTEPLERMNLIKLYDRQISSLELGKLSDMNQETEVVFLTSKLDLYSFALHDDLVDTLDAVEIIQKAEMTACKLIQVISQLDLKFAPAHWLRSIIFAGVLLIKILKSPNAGNRPVINRQLCVAHEIFSSMIKQVDDGNQRADRLMLLFSVLEDKKKWPPIQCRSTASLFYDAIRVSKEYYEDILDNLMNEIDDPHTPSIP